MWKIYKPDWWMTGDIQSNCLKCNYNSILAPIHTCSCFNKTLDDFASRIKANWASGMDRWNKFRSVDASRKFGGFETFLKTARHSKKEKKKNRNTKCLGISRDNITWRWVPYRRIRGKRPKSLNKKPRKKRLAGTEGMFMRMSTRLKF